MSKGWIIGGGLLAGLLVIGFVLVAMVIGISNREVSLRVTIEQKQKDNTNEYDNMWKKISQVAQVTDKQASVLKDIFVSYADARTSDGAGSVMNWIKEAIPNVDTTTFNNLQNIITSARDSFTFRQKELLDLKREHDKMLQMFPSNIVLGMLGRKAIDVTIVTSSRTSKSFETGKDDDVNVFQKEAK